MPTLEMSRGDHRTFTLTASEDVSAATSLIFTAKRGRGNLPDTAAIFQHALGAGLTVDGAAIALETAYDDTKDLTGDTLLVCDVQAEWADRGPVTVWEGELRVRADVTRERDTSVPIHTTEPSATQNAIAAAADAEAARVAAVAAQTAAEAAQTATEAARDAAIAARLAAELAETNSSAAAVAAQLAQSLAEQARDAAAAAQAAAEAAQAAAEAARDTAGTHATNASASASAAATSAGTATTKAAEASASATNAAGHATNAANSATAAAASASAAASSATAAANALAITYKGGVAGASVPATSTLAGDYYRITSAGSSQGKTWTTGDLAIYNGTSGSWTQIPAGFIDEARVLTGTSGRAVRPSLYSNGADTNRRFEQTPGSPGAIAGMPCVFYGYIDVPTSNGSVFAYAFASCGSGTTTPGLQPNAFYIAMSTSGTLRVAQAGATNGDTDYRRLEYGAFRTTYSGRQRLPIAVVFESGDTTTNPKIYIAGVDVSASFTLTTGGTAPNWMPTTLDTTKFISGYNWSAGRFEPFRVCLGSWTAAEVLEWAQTGNEPTWCQIATGSAVNKITNVSRNSDFGAGATDWAGVSTGTGTVNAGALDINLPAHLTDRVDLLTSFFGGWVAGRKYRVVATVSNLVGRARFRIGVTNLAVGEVANGAFAADFIPDTSNLSASLQVVAINAAASLTLDNVKILDLGPISKPQIQPGAPVATDSGANRIPGLLTAGLTALGDKPEMVAVLGNPMTADGFVLADQVVTPDGYELIAAYIERTAGSGTGTITVKETSSGGTTVATGAVASGTVSLTVSNGLSASNKKLHLANSSWSSTTIQPRFVFRRFK